MDVPQRKETFRGKARPLPPVERLRELFVYSEESESCLRWRKERPCLLKLAGARAGSKDRAGAWSVRIVHEKKVHRFKVNRVIWVLFTGEDPGSLLVVPKNGNVSDCRIDNLELLTWRQLNARTFRKHNGQEAPAESNNESNQG